MSEDRNQLIEQALCQGLFDAGQAEVTCPDTIRAAVAATRQQALLKGESPNLEVIDRVEALPRRVIGRLSMAGDRYLLELELVETQGGKVLKQQNAKSRTFEGLVDLATQAGQVLLQE